MEPYESTIILCAGSINYANLPIGTNLSNAMIPLNGKPVISWILDDLLTKGIHRVVVVLEERDFRLLSFLKWAYEKRMGLVITPVKEGGSILHSLQAGLHHVLTPDFVRIILGDTLITDRYCGSDDFVYVGTVNDPGMWCVAQINQDGWICNYQDKENLPRGTYYALSGYYHLQHTNFLKECICNCISDGQSELSDVLSVYGAVYPIRARIAQNWYDFGHIDNLVIARHKLIQTRHFNSLTIDSVLNTITKVSENNDKLHDELEWYTHLPEELKVLTPRILHNRTFNGHLEITQEYYGYPTLAELYLYSDLSAGTWESILRRLLQIHQKFRTYSGNLEQRDIESIYLTKTWARVSSVEESDTFWESLLAKDLLIINQRLVKNIGLLEQQIQYYSKHLINTTEACIIHGDFCFSNILFDVNHQIARLIDPRGSFGRPGIYGDPRYDIAKLRHSVSGLYDFIVADMFDIQSNEDGFKTNLFVSGIQAQVAAHFDEMIVEAGYNLEEIRYIEGLLFVSMIPLHQGHFKRQLMMFLTGLSLLNEVMKCVL